MFPRVRLQSKQRLEGTLLVALQNNFSVVIDFEGRYKFTISFENAPQKYWMTEKLFAALAAGSIPSTST